MSETLTGARTAPRSPRDGLWRDKTCAMDAAISVLKDGDLLGLGGLALCRSPVAAALEILRQGRRALRLLDYIAGFEGDVLVGGGAIASVQSCYFGLDVLGLAPMYRQAAERGALRVIEETEATIAYGLRAARAGVDFQPVRTFAGTDMLTVRPDLRLVGSPYSDDVYVAVPALIPDVAIVHVAECDRDGNAVFGSAASLDVDLAAAARVTIVTAERIVETETIARQGADLLGMYVDHVVHAPRGAWPASCLPGYNADFALLADYVEACPRGEFDAFLRERVLAATHA